MSALDNYAPAATYHGVIQPYWLTTADINGDGIPEAQVVEVPHSGPTVTQ